VTAAALVLLLWCCCYRGLCPLLADELESCRLSEQELREQMCEAVRSAEAQATRKAEDAYQEASYAGEACALFCSSKAAAAALMQQYLQ
jgi:hypothetical protein